MRLRWLPAGPELTVDNGIGRWLEAVFFQGMAGASVAPA